MAFRMLLIENEVNIKLNLDNLVITKEGKDIWLSLIHIFISLTFIIECKSRIIFIRKI